MLLRRALALEGVINGKVSRELEYTFYVKLGDMTQLQKASTIEKHEQWQIPLDTDKRIRARLRLINDRRPTMTTKVKRDGVLGWEEVDADIPLDLFNHLREASINGYKKTRYYFPIPGRNTGWEVDVFMDRSGNPHCWVKVDLEVHSPDDEVPELPFEYEELLIDNSPKLTVGDIAFIRNLWENEWQQIDQVSVSNKPGSNK